MRVVSSQSEEKVRRKRARDDLVWPLRSLTANLLRIIRGSGKPHLLMKQMDACLNALGAFVEAHGSAPSAHEISKILDPDETFRRHRPWIEETKRARRTDDDTGEESRADALRLIRRGALQAAASMLLNQLPQFSTGENDMYEGIFQLEKIKVAKRAKYRGRSRTSVDEILRALKKRH
jgi:hypothetical protein